MEAASRPTLEPLSDLPLEAPVDTGADRAGAAAAPAPSASPDSTDAKDPVQTSIQFLDPASLVLDPALARAESAAPVPPPVPPPVPKEAAEELELVLEDPAVIEELLTSPPRPRPPANTTAPDVTLSGAAPAVAAPATRTEPAVNREEVRVPIAKTASLSSAATKLTAAKRLAPKLAPAPPAPVPTARMAPASVKSPAKPVSAPATEGLASWTSARAAATAAPKLAPPPAPPSAPQAYKIAPKGAPPPSSSASVAGASSAPMDRDFIARNQVVERYLSGRLPLKGATEFEQFCHRHPELLDEIGLPERVNAGLRLLEASGKPEPWQEAPRPAWQKPQVTLALAAAAALLGVALLVLTGANASKSNRITNLQKQVAERPLDPATSTREIRLLPSRSGASNAPAISIGGAATQLADFKIDESRSPYHIFRVTIDRIDQGRVGIISNLVKDSNGHLRIALNSSALGPGNYQLTIEGMNWRGDPEPDSWITIGIVR